jgi:hypothetical protein
LEELTERPRVRLRSPLFSTGTKPVLDTSLPGQGSSDPDDIDQWLQRLDDDLAPFLNPAPSSLDADWSDLEFAYWSQWLWPTSGPVSRDPQFEHASDLDLLYTTRYGGLPVAPLHGGNLSILQWSRIIALALDPQFSVPPPPVSAATSQLKISDIGALPEGMRRLHFDRDIVVICPQSAQSRSATWQPDQAFPSLALMPSKLVIGNRRPEQSVAKLGESGQAGDARPKAIDPLTKALKEASARAIVQFIEADGPDVTGTAALARYQVARPPRSCLTFGFGGGEGVAGPYLDRPRDLRHLVELARQQYSFLLPSSMAEERSLSGRLNLMLRRIWYSISRIFGRPTERRRQRVGNS